MNFNHFFIAENLPNVQNFLTFTSHAIGFSELQTLTCKPTYLLITASLQVTSHQRVPQEAVARLPCWHVPPAPAAVQPLSLLLSLSRHSYWRFRLSPAVANGGILVPAVANGGTSFPAGNNGGIQVHNRPCL